MTEGRLNSTHFSKFFSKILARLGLFVQTLLKLFLAMTNHALQHTKNTIYR